MIAGIQRSVMNFAQLRSARMSLPLLATTRALTASFNSICRHAAACLRTLPAVALVIGALSGSTASAQTAHLSQTQTVLNLPTTLDWPQAVAVDANGNIYVGDPYNHRVVKLTPSEGGFVLSTVGTGFNMPYGVALDASGDVYITDIFATTLFKETPNGSGGYTQTTIGSGLYDAVSVAVDTQGNVYGTEINNSFVGTLFKETLSGSTYTQSFLPAPGTHGVEFVAVDGFGDLFLADGWDNKVFEDVPLAGGGYTTTQIPGNSGPFAVDSENNVYIGGLDYISKLTPNGSGGFNTSVIPIDNNSVPTPYGYFDAPGLAVDRNGNLFFDDLYTFNLIEESMSGANAGQLYVQGTSYPVSMFFTFDTEGTLGSYSILTDGVPNTEFTDSFFGNCYAGSTYPTGYTCNVDVSFTPAAPGPRSGAVVLNDGLGNPFATAYVQGTGVSPLVAFPGAPPAPLITGLFEPQGVTVDATGNVIVANSGTGNVLFTPPGGTQSPVGSGFNNPTGVAEDGAGNIFVVGSGSVYEIAKATGVPTQLNLIGVTEPNDLAIDGAGNLYISEPNLGKVIKVTPSGVQTSVGAGLSAPRGIAVDAGGNVYIADYSAGNVDVVTPSGAQSTISGFGGPSGVAVDAAGNVYVAVFGSGELVEVAPGGERTTLASGLSEPYSVALDSFGNLYFTQYGTGAVTKIDRTDAPSLAFAETPAGETSTDSPRTVTLSNNGNAALDFPGLSSSSNPAISANFVLSSSGASACPLVPANSSALFTLPAGASCLLPISFEPLTPGSNSGTLAITDNNLNSNLAAGAPVNAVQSISLSGIGAPAPATLLAPATGSPLTDSSVNFIWTPSATEYALRIGSTGAGSTNLYNGPETTNTSGTVSNLPLNGETVYVRLWTLVNTVWQYNDYTFTAVTGSPATMNSPSVSNPLSGPSQLFMWSNGVGVTQYALRIGSTGAGSTNLYNGPVTTNTSTTVNNLPTNGETVYVRLWSLVGGFWQYIDYTYTAFTNSPATMNSPSVSNPLSGPSQLFVWSNGAGVTEYALRIGSTGAGSTNLYNGPVTTNTSTTVTNLPTNGEAIYVRLWSFVGGVWQYIDYTYTAFTGTPSAMNSPSGGSTLGGASQLFNWSKGVGVTEYALRIGSTGAGSTNLYNGPETTALSAMVNNLPTNGETVYVRLWSFVGGVWQYIDYTYTAD